MRTLLHHLKRYRLQCILSPLFKMLEAIMELLVPLVVKEMIDYSREPAEVWRNGLLLIGFGLLGLLFSTIAQYFAAKAATGGCASLRGALFCKIQSLSYQDLDEIGTATLVNRLTGDMNQVQTGVNMALRLALRSPFVVFGAMVMTFTIHAEFGRIVAITIAVLTVLVVLIGQLTTRAHTCAQQQQDRLLLRTRENLTGVRVLRAFNRQAAEQEGFDGDLKNLYHRQLRAGNLANLLNPLTYVLVNLAMIIVLNKSHTIIMENEYGVLTIGAVAALVNYLSQILVELIKLTNLVNTIAKGVASAGRIEQILRLPQTRQSGTRPLPERSNAPLLRFNGVSFRYPQAGEDALRNLSFTVPEGESLGIIGSTGSGKSTLLQLMGRFYEPGAGEITIAGVPAAELDTAALRGCIGMVPQHAVLFAGTLAENLRWGRADATDEELWQALAAARAEDFVRAMPLGLESPVEQDGRNFSGGQRQRLTIARALVRRPRLLILDDSTSALDFATEAALRKALCRLPFACTLVVASQRVSAVRFLSRIAVLDEGRLAGLGTHEDLLKHCTVYREMAESQNPHQEAAL